MNFWACVKTDAIVCTQSQPVSGIKNWKKAYTQLIPHCLVRLMFGSEIAFTMETENASIARPIPKRIEFIKNIKLHDIMVCIIAFIAD